MYIYINYKIYISKVHVWILNKIIITVEHVVFSVWYQPQSSKCAVN